MSLVSSALPGKQKLDSWLDSGMAETPLAKPFNEVLGMSTCSDTEQSILSARMTPAAAGVVSADRSPPTLQHMQELLHTRDELAKERKARVSAEASVTVLMHDATLLRGQADQAERCRSRADCEWRAAVNALEVGLADRGFGGFGLERQKMAAEITTLKSSLESQERDNRWLQGELEALKFKFSNCSLDLEREKQNARRLAAIAADREANRESEAHVALLAANATPDRITAGSETREDAEVDKLLKENARLKSFIRSIENSDAICSHQLSSQPHAQLLENSSDRLSALGQEVFLLQEILRERSSADKMLLGKAAVEHDKAKNAARRVAELEEEVRKTKLEEETRNSKLQTEIFGLQETLQKQARISVEGLREHEVDVVKLTALQDALAAALKRSEILEKTVRALEAHISTEKDSIAAVECELLQSTQRASLSSHQNKQKQLLLEDWERRHAILEADWHDKDRRITQLLEESSFSSQKSMNQSTLIQDLQVQVKDLKEQLASARAQIAVRPKSEADGAEMDAILNSLMNTADRLNIHVSSELHSTFSNLMSRALDAEEHNQYHKQRVTLLEQHENDWSTEKQELKTQLNDQITTLQKEKKKLASQLRIAEKDCDTYSQVHRDCIKLKTECACLKEELHVVDQHATDLHSCVQSLEQVITRLGQVCISRNCAEQRTTLAWSSVCENQRKQHAHEMAIVYDLISKHDAALDGLSHLSLRTLFHANAMVQQHTISLSQNASEMASLRQTCSEALVAAVFAKEQAESAKDSSNADNETKVELEYKLKEAMEVVEAAVAFKSNLDQQMQRISLAREADRNSLTLSAKKIHTLQARVQQLEQEYKDCNKSRVQEQHSLQQLLETIEDAQSTLDSTMALSASSAHVFESKLAALNKINMEQAAQYGKQESQHESHRIALQRLQEQHERLLAELEGREKLIALMEEQYVGLHTQLLQVEDQNRELRFFVQGHSIVQDIEHAHLEQALTRANAAAQVVVEAKSHQQKYTQQHRQSIQHAAEFQTQISAMETRLLELGASLEKALVAAADLLKYRNLVTHARNPLFVPTTRSGAQLSDVMARNVCFLIENAGVPIVRRRADVTEELVIFFAEQFDSWMQEIIVLTDQKQGFKTAMDDLRIQLLSAQDRIFELEESTSTLRKELQSTRKHHVQETEETWKEIKRITSVSPPLDVPDLKAFEELQHKNALLEASLLKLHEENSRIHGERALQRAGFSPRIGSPAMLALRSPTMSAPRMAALSSVSYPTRSSLEVLPAPAEAAHVDDSDMYSEVKRLHSALDDAIQQNKQLLDEVEILCAMKEAADEEIHRLQGKLNSFVDHLQHQSKASVSIRRGLLPRTLKHRPARLDQDDDSD